MKKVVLILSLLVSCLLPSVLHAADRNIFGLHLTQTSDIDKVAPVINSTGGDWGWVTIVIRQDQLNHQTWQEFFDKCRRLHLIPIIRLSTIMEKDHWRRPQFSDIDSLAAFLNGLNWPTTSRHIILFNEINHQSEWGGEVDIKSYTDIAIYSANLFKSLGSDYVIMGSALDLAAPEKLPQSKSAKNVFQEIYLYRPEYFLAMDALASHSYPNYGYVGLPSHSGQHSIRGYQWEKSYLKSLGVAVSYPVFITETGWPHREGEFPDRRLYTTKTTVDFLLQALKIWSQDTTVTAVTPFIYNFPHPPFDHFSWLDTNEQLYPQYQRIVSSPKTTNSPPQKTEFIFVKNHLPLLMFSHHEYGGQIVLKNTGQSIWGETNFCLTPKASKNITVDALCTTNQYIQPDQLAVFNYKFSINSTTPESFISWHDLPEFDINPVINNGIIYSPKLSISEKIIQYFQNLSL